MAASSCTTIIWKSHTYLLPILIKMNHVTIDSCARPEGDNNCWVPLGDTIGIPKRRHHTTPHKRSTRVQTAKTREEELDSSWWTDTKVKKCLQNLETKEKKEAAAEAPATEGGGGS